MQPTILVADDEKIIRDSMAQVLTSEGLRVVTAEDGERAVKLLRKEKIAVALLDIRMPKVDGMQILSEACEIAPETQFVIITAYGTIENAVMAMKLGASDYVTKPFVFDEVLIKIKRLLQLNQLHQDNLFLQDEVRKCHGFREIVGCSRGLSEVLAVVQKLANGRTSALITGESGTGKELIARAIHYSGITQKGRFVAVNCAALPETLVESELFGHKRGAFTGPTRDKPGLFEVADNGTIFLDEIATMPLNVQPKLLRVIEEKRFTPIGGTDPIDTNVRILCASNRCLKTEVAQGNFRGDLYYRLNVVEIHIPPLRERREDIAPLANHFIRKYGVELGKSVKGITNRAMQAMMTYAWPGNIRELENVIERAVIFVDDRPIDLLDLPFVGEDVRAHTFDQLDLKSTLRDFERQYILQVLRSNDFDKHATAKELNIGLSSLYRKIDELDIESRDRTEAVGH